MSLNNTVIRVINEFSGVDKKYFSEENLLLMARLYGWRRLSPNDSVAAIGQSDLFQLSSSRRQFVRSSWPRC